VTGFCEDGNERSNSMESGEFHYWETVSFQVERISMESVNFWLINFFSLDTVGYKGLSQHFSESIVFKDVVFTIEFTFLRLRQEGDHTLWNVKDGGAGDKNCCSDKQQFAWIDQVEVLSYS
jgi:hypothetical protein